MKKTKSTQHKKAQVLAIPTHHADELGAREDDEEGGPRNGSAAD